MVVLVTETTGLPTIASVGVTVRVVEPDLLGSSVLVAVTVTDVPVAGTVSTPAGVIEPADAVHLTAELKLLVPVTEEAQLVVELAHTVDAAQVTDTPVIVGSGVTATTVDADFAGFATLVAVTVTEVPVVVAGAVNRPFAEIVPPDTVHVTALEKLPVPVTGAVQVVVLLAARLVTPQAMETPVTVELGATATTTDADLVGSCVLVAVTVTEVPLVGAVRTPVGLIVPADAAQFTAEE